MTTEEKVLTKIRRLLALATSPNENEAQAAMLKAQELMAKNQLSMSDVDVATGPKKVIELDAVADYMKLPFYYKHIARVLADNFKCFYFLRRITYNRCGMSKIVFAGLESDVEMAKEVFKFATAYLDNKVKLVRCDAKRKYPHYSQAMLNGYANDYAFGFIAGLERQFKEQVEKNQWGLILVKDKDVVAYHDNMNLKTGSSWSIGSAGSSDAYANGFKEGKSFSSPRGAIEGGK